MQPTRKTAFDRAALTRYAWLSIATAAITILLKWLAYRLTGSMGLLSDALESCVNLVGAVMALCMLTLAARAADAKHAFGHSKAEYFSSAAEGILIVVAAIGIGYAAIERILHPRALEQVGVGLAVSIIASVLNFAVARILMQAARQHHSITLEADAQHLMTDVLTSVGVIAGVGLVALTGWSLLDPIVALLVSANIIWTGASLVRRSVDGLMDVVLPEEELKLIEGVMAVYREKKVEFHALRTRQAASRRFISVHMLVPGNWTVHDAHLMAEDFEGDLRAALGDVLVTTHLEPIDDETSFNDVNDK